MGALASTLVDISGWYTPAALAVFMLADLVDGTGKPDMKAWLARHLRLIAVLGVVCALSLAVTVYAYAVAHEGLFLSMGGTNRISLGRLALDFAYLFDVGLLVSLLTPFVYARLPLVLLAALGGVALLTWGAGMLGAWRAATRAQRITLGTMAAVLAGTCLMVNLGRPSEGTVIVRWAAKHIGPAFIWLGLLLAFAWHIAWSRAEGNRRVLLAEITLVSFGVFWGAQFTFGQLGRAVSFPPFGYSAEIRDAIDRRNAVREIDATVVQPIARAGGSSRLVVPTLDGPYLARRCPGLFEYNLTAYRPFFGSAATRITFVRTAAMHPWRPSGVATVPSLRQAVSPEFIALLATPGNVREYYFGHVPLRVAARAAPPEERFSPEARADGKPLPFEPDGTVPVASNGKLEVSLRPQAFDPETAYNLRLAIDRTDAATPPTFTLHVLFGSDLAGSRAGGSITLPARSGQIFEVDLRQLYAFALSPEVRDVRLAFTDPGQYRLRIATLVP
jgi:hypothetical protein